MNKKVSIVVVSVAGLFFVVWQFLSQPFWLQRIEHRRAVIARVNSAGGWDALRNDCLHLVQTNQTNWFLWNKWQTNNETVLPPAIAALQPMFVEFYSSNFVYISIYGMGETGHRGIAPYGLEVICDSSANSDEPKLFPNLTYRKMADKVYEFFY